MGDLVSCLMVTRNRVGLAERAVACFAAQTWAERELVIIDDGDDDYAPMLMRWSAMGLRIRYHRIEPDSSARLGALRNLSIDAARGEWCLQWDDDEWYHPDRIRVQMEARRGGAVALKHTLVDIPCSPHGHLAFRADSGIATPGTILFRKGVARYENLPKNEDGLFLRSARRSGLTVLGKEYSHLFVRCFHGTNTWDQAHFLRRLRRRPIDLVHWLAASTRGDIRRHPAFDLTAAERQTIAAMQAFRADHAVSA